MTEKLTFQSSYEQLSPAERALVDAIVRGDRVMPVAEMSTTFRSAVAARANAAIRYVAVHRPQWTAIHISPTGHILAAARVKLSGVAFLKQNKAWQKFEQITFNRDQNHHAEFVGGCVRVNGPGLSRLIIELFAGRTFCAPHDLRSIIPDRPENDRSVTLPDHNDALEWLGREWPAILTGEVRLAEDAYFVNREQSSHADDWAGLPLPTSKIARKGKK